MPASPSSPTMAAAIALPVTNSAATPCACRGSQTMTNAMFNDSAAAGWQDHAGLIAVTSRLQTLA